MGQTFQIFNHDKEAFITPPAKKAIELTTTPVVGGVLLYLFNDSIPAKVDPGGLAGAWSGDDVRIQGDYHESDDWSKTVDRKTLVHAGTEYITKGRIKGPIDLDRSSVHRGDVVTSWTNKNAAGAGYFSSPDSNLIAFEGTNIEPGDDGLVNTTTLDAGLNDERGQTVVTYKENHGPEWADKTETATQAFRSFLKDEAWLDQQENATVLRPDGVATTTEDGTSQVITGSQTIMTAGGMSEEETTQLTLDAAAAPHRGPCNSATTDSQNHFIITNQARNEYITRSTPEQDRELVTEPVTAAMISYLLFDSLQDGTRFAQLHNPSAPEFEEEMAEKMSEQRERHQNRGRTSPYRTDDGGWDKRRLATVIAAGHQISEDFLYAGRWKGDPVAIHPTTGQTATDILNSRQWVDITDRLENALAAFTAPEWVDTWRGAVASE